MLRRGRPLRDLCRLRGSRLTTFVLVHGGWHGAWCWYRVAPLLERLGHTVITPDLPGHGRDPTPAGSVTLAAYADRVSAALAAAGKPAVLVGHSMGGMAITQAAADHPEHVALLVYLAAFLPRDGQSLADLAEGETENLLTPNSVPNAQRTAILLREDALRPALYADCREEDIALARRLIRPEPLAPLSQPIRAAPERLDRIPRVYLECRHDRALPLARQRLMQAARPCREVIGLESGHSPFFSVPDSLVEYLARL